MTVNETSLMRRADQQQRISLFLCGQERCGQQELSRIQFQGIRTMQLVSFQLAFVYQNF